MYLFEILRSYDTKGMHKNNIIHWQYHDAPTALRQGMD